MRTQKCVAPAPVMGLGPGPAPIYGHMDMDIYIYIFVFSYFPYMFPYILMEFDGLLIHFRSIWGVQGGKQIQ